MLNMVQGFSVPINKGNMNNENETKNTQIKGLNYLTIKEVASKIKLLDESATLRWLYKNNINIYKISKKNVVYQLEVDCAIEKPFAKYLKKLFPNNWESTYRFCTTCEAVYNLVVMQIKSNIINTPQTQVNIADQSEQKLLNRLMR